MSSPKKQSMISAAPKGKRSLSPSLPALTDTSPSASAPAPSSVEERDAKRQRIASSASQDSDEHGQNALGISFGGPVGREPFVEDTEDREEIEEMAEAQTEVEAEGFKDKGKGKEVADSQRVDDVDEEDAPSEEKEDDDKQVVPVSQNSFTPVNPAKLTPLPSGRPGSIVSASTTTTAARPPPGYTIISVPATAVAYTPNPNDVKLRLSKGGKFIYGPQEVNLIWRWMHLNGTFKVAELTEEFNELLISLGYMDDILSVQEKHLLRQKLRQKMKGLHRKMGDNEQGDEEEDEDEEGGDE